VLVALAVKVYATPLVKPVTVIGDDAPVADIPPGVEIALNCVIADPPLELAVNKTEALALSGTAVPIVGATGTTALAV